MPRVSDAVVADVIEGLRTANAKGAQRLALDLRDARDQLRRLARVNELRDCLLGGYAVHRGCGGEIEAERCQGCAARVTRGDVLTPEDARESLLRGYW